MAFLKKLKRGINYLNDFSTSKKIVVIQSDDWGSVRMPSKKISNSIPEKYRKHYQSPYYKYDTLARKKDLEGLFEVLNSVKDKNGRSAVVTANVIMANPDFNKIQKDNFERYSYENFKETIKRYYSQKTFDSWTEGIENGCFFPQLHGRDHLYVNEWLRYLRNGHDLYRDAFDRGIYSADHNLKDSKKNLTASYAFNRSEDIAFQLQSTEEACDLFTRIFGYKSKSFVAASYTWYGAIEKTLSSKGVDYIQSIRLQKIPKIGTETDFRYYRKSHYTGEQNKKEQTYLIRNAHFEPSIFTNALESCLRRIKFAFLLNKPAVICMHRLNVIGALDEANRSRNLKLLKQLLNAIVNNWPDVEFMNTVELGNVIANKR